MTIKISIKHSVIIFLHNLNLQNNDESEPSSNTTSESADIGEDLQQKEIISKHMSEKKQQQHQHEKSLKNTFGWARIDVLTMVIACTFLTSLCFSIVVEVLHTFFHVGHNDHQDHEGSYHTYSYEICIILGALGLVLNGLSYLLIGGYTYHQGSFLQLTADGNVYILDRVVTDGRKISDSKAKIQKRSKKIHELGRDVCSEYQIAVFAKGGRAYFL